MDDLRCLPLFCALSSDTTGGGHSPCTNSPSSLTLTLGCIHNIAILPLTSALSHPRGRAVSYCTSEYLCSGELSRSWR
jgi:hypothetical protein